LQDESDEVADDMDSMVNTMSMLRAYQVFYLVVGDRYW